MKIRRIKDGKFIREFEETPVYRHIVFTPDVNKGKDFSEEECSKICDFDFLGNSCSSFKSGTINRKPEYERWVR